MSHALSSREHANHRRRHCAKRATLPARLAADCTPDASASASDENSAALELHEAIVPLARERPPCCARTTAVLAVVPSSTEPSWRRSGRQCGREPFSLSPRIARQ
jgi:hypothetical protein